MHINVAYYFYKIDKNRFIFDDLRQLPLVVVKRVVAVF
jgi:hypothetical protein